MESSDGVRTGRRQRRHDAERPTPLVAAVVSDGLIANIKRHCPCELVTAYVIGEFRPAALLRLADLVRPGTTISFPPDTALERAFQAIACYCQFCLRRILNELIKWREESHAGLVAKKHRHDHRHQELSPVMNTQSGSTMTISPREMAIDVVFAEASIAALSRFDGSTIWERFASLVEDATIGFCREEGRQILEARRGREGKIAQAAINLFGGACGPQLPIASPVAAYLSTLWTLLLGRISTARLRSISEMFLRGLETDDHVISVLLLRSMRSVQVTIDTTTHVGAAIDFIRIMFGHFESSSGRPLIKDAICSALTNILYPVALLPRQNVDLTVWYALMTSIFVQIRRWSRKVKHRTVGLPLLTTVLCVCDPEHFITNFGLLLESLISFYDDRETRLSALACIQRLLHVYLEQVAFRKNATSNNLDTVIRRIIFGAHKRLSYADGSHQQEHDGLVAIILTVAEGKFDYCIQEVILRMLLSVTSESVVNEQVQLALRSLIAMFDRGERRVRLFTSLRTDPLPAGFRTHHGPNILTMLESVIDRLAQLSPFQTSSLSQFSDSLGALLAKILLECHRRIGHNLLSTGSSLSAHTVKEVPGCTSALMLITSNDSSESLDSEITEQIHLPTIVYRFALCTLPHIWTTDIVESDLMHMVIEACVHRNEAIRAAAMVIVEHIELTRRDLLGRFCARLASYILSSVPVLCTPVVVYLLSMLDRLLQGSSTADISPETAAGIEAASLFWMCAMSPRIRLICFRILDATRQLVSTPFRSREHQGRWEEKRGDDMSASPRRSDSERIRPQTAIDVIESNEESIVSIFSRRTLPDLIGAINGLDEADGDDWRLIGNIEFVDRPDVIAFCQRTSAIRIVHAAVSSADDDQDRWTIYLAEIIRRIAEKYNGSSSLQDPLRIAFAEASTKLKVHLIEPPSSPVPARFWFLWRNIAMFALVSSSNAGGGSYPQAASELAESIVDRSINALRNNGTATTAILIGALGNVALGSVDLVLAPLPPLVDITTIVYPSSTSPPPRIHPSDAPVRLYVAHIHRLISEGLSAPFLIMHDAVRLRLISFIRASMSHLERTGEFGTRQHHHRRSQEGLELRRHLTVVIQRLCEESFAGNNPLELTLRTKIFEFLSRADCMSNSPVSPVIVKRRKSASTVAKEQRLLDHGTLTAMAALLLGPYLEPSGVVPDRVIFPWINKVLGHNDARVRDIGSLALKNMLTSNANMSEIVEYFLQHSYSAVAGNKAARRFFMALGEYWMDHNAVRIHLGELVHLIVYKLGDVSFTVRSMALDMLPVLAEKRPGNISGRHAPYMIISSRLPDTYLQVQLIVSTRFANEYHDSSDQFIASLWKYMPSVSSSDQLIMLRYCQPWIHGIDLSSEIGRNLLELLFRVTIEHGVNFAAELQQIWKDLALTRPTDTSGSSISNVQCALKFILVKCCLVERQRQAAQQSKSIICETSRRITLYLARVSRDEVCQILINEICDKSDSVFGELLEAANKPTGGDMLAETLDLLDRRAHLATTDEVEESPGLYPPSEEASDNHILIDTTSRPHHVVVHDESIANSTSHIALMLLVEVAYELDVTMLSSISQNVLPLIHAGVLGLDHHVFDIRENSKFILLNLVHAVSFRGQKSMGDDVDNGENGDANQHRKMVARRNDARRIMDHLMSRCGLPLWRREVIADDNLALHSSSQLASMVDAMIRFVDPSKPSEVARQWSRYTFEWIAKTTNAACPILASRCHQIFRTLTDRLPASELISIIDQLERSLDATLGKSGMSCVASEIIATIVIIIDRLANGAANKFPELLWRAVTILDQPTTSVHLFVHTATLIIAILDKIDVNDAAVRSAIMRPKSITNFGGIQTRVLRGLSSLLTRLPASYLLSRLTCPPFSEFIDPGPGRFVMNLVGLLPWLLENTGGSEQQRPTPVIQAARNLHVTWADNSAMAAVFATFLNDAQISSDALSQAIAPPLVNAMTAAGVEVEACTLLASMVAEGTMVHKRNILILLGAIFAQIDWARSPLRRQSGSPLLHMLIGEHNGTLRPEVMQVLSIVLQNTCGAGPCANWTIPESHSPSPSRHSPPRRSPSPTPRSSPVQTAKPIEQIVGEDRSRQSEEDLVDHTWDGDWARDRRSTYSTHSRRLSLISNRWRQHAPTSPPTASSMKSPLRVSSPQPPAIERDSPNAGQRASRRAPSTLYPALYRQASSLRATESVPQSPLNVNDSREWSAVVGSEDDAEHSFGYLQRVSTLRFGFLPSAPSLQRIGSSRMEDSLLNTNVSEMQIQRSPSTQPIRRRGSVSIEPITMPTAR